MDILRTPYHEDIPKAYKFQNDQGKEMLVGSYGKLIQYFADYMNYTLQLVEENNYRTTVVRKNIQRKFYNISLHSDSYESHLAHIGFSYPLESSNTCVMVPAKDELPRYWYIAWPFGRYIWSFLLLLVIYVAYVMTSFKHPSKSYGTNLLYSLSLVMYCSNASLQFNNIPLRLQLFYALLFVLGFIMSSYYCSFLTMYNMRPVFQPFINSIEDALQANIKIAISSNMLEELKSKEYQNFTRISKLLKEKSSNDVVEQIKQMNRTFAYVVTGTQWIFISKLQKNLIQPVYQLSDICFGKVFITYPIQLEAKFAHDLDIFIMLIKQSGLWELWEEEGFLLALSGESYNLLEDEYPVDPLNLYYFRIAWIILIGGLALSVLGFVLEILVFKYRISCQIRCIRKGTRRV